MARYEEEIESDLGTRVLEERTRQRLTQKELASRVSLMERLSSADLSRIETSSVRATKPSTVRALAKGLGVSIGYLIENQPTAFMLVDLAANSSPKIDPLLDVGFRNKPGLKSLYQTSTELNQLFSVWEADVEMMGTVMMRMRTLRYVEKASVFCALGRPLLLGESDSVMDTVMGLDLSMDTEEALMNKWYSEVEPEDVSARIHKVVGGYDILIQTALRGVEYFDPTLKQYGIEPTVWNLQPLAM